eukprot:55474_1
MGACVSNIPKETTSANINITCNRDELPTSQKYVQTIQDSVHEHDSSSDEIKQNISSYLSKTEPNVTIKYDLSSDSQPYTERIVSPISRVRDSFACHPSNTDATTLCGVHHFDEMLLFGFIGDIETKTSLIPMAICKIVLIYYSDFIGNTFDSMKCADKIQISAPSLRASKLDDSYGYYSVYHSVWIDSLSCAVIVYDLSVVCRRSTSIFIGFSATDNVINDGFWANTDDYNYAVSLGGSKYLNGHRQDYNEMCALSITSGDSIKIKLDLINDEISIRAMNGEELIIFKNIRKRYSIKYKFAAGFSWNAHQNDSIIMNNIEHYGL